MANEFNSDVGGPVKKAEALQWIDKYDKERKDKDKDTKSIFFGRQILEEILAQPGCSGISFFFGMKYSDYAKKDTANLVMVGTREDGTLIWAENAAGKDGESSIVADSGTQCPPYCPR